MPSWGGAGKGAATGAAIGSVVPGLGTGVGAGIGGIIGGLFGKSKPAGPGAATGAKPGANPNDPSAAISASLQKSGADNRKRAGALGAEGDEAMRLATDFFKRMAGGDPTATSPQVGMVVDQYDTARKNIAEFGGRGGGTTSASAQSRVDEAHQIADVRAGGMTQGAQSLAAIGANEQGLALSANQLASMDLNAVMAHALGEKTLAANVDIAKSGQRASQTSALAQGLGQLLGLYLTRNKAA